MSDVLARVRAHLRDHFGALGITEEPVEASVTFLGADPIDVIRFGMPDDANSVVAHYISVGCSRHPMVDPGELLADPVRGPRAEIVVALRGPSPAGLARSAAVVAAAPAVEGLILEPDALVDLETPV
ncbi:MAG: suppressor of fused domain protein, partial [Dietzia sp.]|nr:suppressor of fused domain protein [Dietzia sp.]